MSIKPMLAHQAKDESAALRDPRFVAERKYDGHRSILTLTPTGGRFLSRLGKDKTCGVPFASSLRPPKSISEVVLDGELMIPGGTSSDVVDLARKDELVYVAFDVLTYKGNDGTFATPMELLFQTRRLLLSLVVSQIAHPKVRLSELSDKPLDLFEQVKAAGGEGIMLKDLNGVYSPGKRSWAWQKVKCYASYDVVVTGCDAAPTQWTVRPGHVGTDGVFYPDGKPSSSKIAGYVGLTYGWYINGRLTTVGSLGYTGSKADLEKFVGKVAEVKAFGVYPSGALRHPGVLRFRDDKLPEECVFTADMANL